MSPLLFSLSLLAAVDEGAVADAVEGALARAEVVRLAVPPVSDKDEARRKDVELAIVRALVDRRREEVITPARLRAKLRAQAEAQIKEITAEELKPFAADHVLLAQVLDEGGKAVLQLKLLKSETGEVVGEASADVGAGGATTASAAGVRTATERLVEQIAYDVETSGAELRMHRTAVAPLVAEGAAKEARLDEFTQSELIRALKRRGFLVVERAQLAAALEQAALGQVLNEQSAPQVGKALGAQSMIVGSVADGGAVFLVNTRLVSVETGAVIGAATAQLPRDDVVAMAAVETRTPLEAGVRSIVAPGWGQAYNGQGVKSLVFGIATYTALATTLGLGVGAIVAESHYNDVEFFQKLPPDERGAAAVEARGTADAYRFSTAIAGAVTATVWGLGIADAFISSPQ